MCVFNVFNYLYLYRYKKIYIKVHVRNVLFIRGAYSINARLNNKKVVLGACGNARARSHVL